MGNKLLSKKLKELRKAYSYTQDDVAAALGIVRQTYSHYETGNRVPGPEMLYKLAGFYHMSIDDLMHLTVDLDKSVYYDAPLPTPSSNELTEFLKYFSEPEQEKKYKFFTPLEKELLYFFGKIDEEDKKEIIEFTKIKARKKK